MARLSLSLLGPFQVTLDGRPVTGFKSNKVRALLAFLAVEAEQPHRREVLAGLLWPDWPHRDALSNLRYALSDLRKVIGDRARLDTPDSAPPFLLVTRHSLQFNPASDAWVDVAAFAELVEADEADLADIDRLERAVGLYRGSFLAGFSIDDSAAFEEWALFTREQMARQASSALHRLAAAYEERGEYERTQTCAWRQLELEPWDEVAHRQVMRALALQGQRTAALAQYETCRRLLAEELGVEPGRETTRLYEQIRDGFVSIGAESPRARRAVAAAPAAPTPMPAARLPSFLDNEGALEVEKPVFVARERELAQLDAFLDLALTGQGRVVFVTGEAGSGKTALAQAFARRAQEAHTDLIVATGSCSAYTGVGDPYLPFRQILELLTGGVEARWAAGATTREHARRLWNVFPLSIEALVEHGPDLVDTFVLRGALLDSARTRPPGDANWLSRLDDLLARKPTGPGSPSPQRIAVFEQYTRVLQALASRAPLVLVLDDLQWADAGSIHLLFHLGRQLAGSRILILGAYRPEEVAAGRRGERHPLDPLVNELRRDYGDIVVDLGQAETRDFTEALLDSEPNRLGRSFRAMLYWQTRGHPLFTIELLRGLQERGDLVQDAEGQWVEGPTLDWETLPARVEAVIAERVGRLDPALRAALQVASVEGERFTAEVVAQVRGTGEQDMLRSLSAQLDRKHRLVRAESIQRVDGQTLSRYQFRHILFQRYLYSSMDKVERVHLHEQVGTALEGLYGAEEEMSAIAVQLALHFQKAGITEKAIHYLRLAGERAVQLSAYQEGVAHLTRGLALLKTVPDSRERTQQAIALQLALGMAWTGAKAFGSPETENAYARARELCQQTEETSQLCRIVGQLATLYYVRAEHQRARELAEEALSLAQEAGGPLLVASGHWQLGFVLFCLGEYATARAHLKQVISFYEPHPHHQAFVLLRGSDTGVSALAYDACCLWCLGYPDQALGRGQQALALARRLGHPFSLADVLCYAGCLLNQMRREAQALKDDAEELMRLAGEKVPGWLGQGTLFRGVARSMLGQVQEGMAQMRQGIAAQQSSGVRCYLSGALGSLAEAQAKAGQPEEGLATLAEALALVEETHERYYEPELHRLRGKLLLVRGDEAEAEASLCKATQVAHRQQAKSWELRATVSLCRLWREQGNREEAQQRLAEIYGWFTEGFDTPDLREARALLAQLSSPT